MRSTAILLAACLWLAGCTGLSHVGHQAGERDGLGGGPARIDTYSYQCDTHSVQIARDRYLDGWYEGNALDVPRTAGMEAS